MPSRDTYRPATSFRVQKPVPGKSYQRGVGGYVAYTQTQDPYGDTILHFLDSGANPPDGVIVTYCLKDKPAGEVTLSFLDAQERLIKTFSSKAPEPEASGKVEQRVPAAAGMNRFIWHMRYPDARLVPGDKLLEDKVGGPLAPPGTYQVRLAVDGDAQTQTFALVKDPRVSASQADFEAQFQFLIAVRDQLSALHDSVNKLRSIRQQVDEWVQRAAGHAAAEAVAKAAGALQEKLSAIEDEVIQVRYKGARDRLDLPAKLNAKLAELTSVVAAADFAPPQQTHDVFQAISGRINLQLGRLEEVIDQDVTGFEHLLRELQIPAIVPRTAP